MKLPEVTASLPQQVAALRAGAGVLWLDELAVLGVRGRDRSAWLNGVVTNDVRVLPPGRGLYTAIVGLKGKILTDAFVDAREDELLLVLPRTRVDELSQHFDRYVVMEDVFFGPRDADVVTVQGPRARSLAERLAPCFDADRLGRGGLDLLVAPEDVALAEEKLSELVAAGALTAVSREAWEVARLEAGVAAFGVDFDTTHFVQEAGITGRAVSFHKGCYLGQEVVCRLAMRGQVQKQLTPLVIASESAPPAGEPVTLDGKEVGRVTSAAPSVSIAGRSVALAMVRHAVVERQSTLEVRGAPAVITARPVP